MNLRRTASGSIPLSGMVALVSGGSVPLLAEGIIFTFVAFLAFCALVMVLLRLRRDALWVVIAAYMVTPGPANNILPSVMLFPVSEVGYGPTELLLVPDFLLFAALIVRARQSGRSDRFYVPRTVTIWGASLVFLAATGFAIGVGAAPLGAVSGQAFLWIRAALVAALLLDKIGCEGWEQASDAVVKALTFGTSVLAAQLVALTALLGDRKSWIIGEGDSGFVVAFDGRVRLPGWGNNVLANAITIGLVLLIFRGHRLPLGRLSRVAIILLHVAALVAGQTRLSLVVASMALLILALLKIKGRPAAAVVAVSLPLGVMVAPVLVQLATRLNPRFASLGDAYGAFTGVTDTFAVGGGSFRTRGELWRAAYAMGADAPLVGHGWASWGYTRRLYDPDLVVAADPHNGYLYAFAEGGLLAILVLYGLALFAVFRRGVPLWLRVVVATALTMEMANPNVFKPQYAAIVIPLVALAASYRRPSVGSSASVPSYAALERGSRGLAAAPTERRNKERLSIAHLDPYGERHRETRRPVDQ